MKDKESHGTANESDIEEPFEIKNVLEKLPKKEKISRSIGPTCRELLNVRNLTFLVEGKVELLHTVKEKLDDVRAMLTGSVQTDGNLLLGSQQIENRKRKLDQNFHQLPKRKKRNRSQKGSESQGISNKTCQISTSRKHLI